MLSAFLCILFCMTTVGGHSDLDLWLIDQSVMGALPNPTSGGLA
jgi:hypothetical protein